MTPPSRPAHRRLNARRARLLAECLEPRALLTITVEPRPQFVAYTGVPEQLVAATFTESDASLTAADFVATIDWGDGTTSPGDITEAADGTFSVSALKSYAEPGSYPIGQGSYPVTVSISSPVNGDAASTAEVDSSLLDATGDGAGTTRGVAGGNQGQYVADSAAGGVVDYDSMAAGSTFITVPGPAGGASSPTGVALLPGATDELVIVTADGTIAVWTNPGDLTPPAAAQPATTEVDHSASGADYEGVTVGVIPTAGGGSESVIYVANFASGRIEAYDGGTFAPVDLGVGAFTDPSLPAGYAPFNVQDINGTIYVAFAEQSGVKDQAVNGAGTGYVDAFDPSGHLLARFDTGGGLDAPSGIALAPSDMGVYAGDLLVANTGDGTISVLDPSDPAAPVGSLPGVLGKVAGPGGGPLVVDGLWSLSTTTYHNYGSVYTYLYDSSDAAEDEVGGFYYNPTLAWVSAQPTTGITDAPASDIDFLGGPTDVLWLGQFADAPGAVDGSDAGSLSVTIDWGDGSPPAAGSLTFESGENLPSGADYAISGIAPYTTPGTYDATVTVTMAGGSSYTADVSVTVVDGTEPIVYPVTVPGGPLLSSAPVVPALNASPEMFDAVQGQTLAAGLASFTYGGSASAPTSDFVATVNWGDGSPPTTARVVQMLPPGAATPYYEVDASHVYHTPGAYAPVIDVTGPNGGTSTVKDSVSVAPDPAGPTDLAISADGNPTVGQPQTTLAIGFDAPAGENFVATVAWGDGTAPSYAVAAPHAPLPGGREFYVVTAPDHAYARAGQYTALFNVIAANGDSDWLTVPVTVLPLPGAPTKVSTSPVSGYAGVGLTGTLASFAGQTNGDVGYRATIDWGDGSPPVFGLVQGIPYPGGAIPPGGAGFTVAGTHEYARTGTYTITIDILAPDGSSTPATTTATITAAPPPTPTNFDPQGAVGVEQGVPTAGLILALFSSTPGLYSATVDWGDGSPPSPGTIVQTGYVLSGGSTNGNLPAYEIRGSHTYAAAGTYTAKVTLLGPGGVSESVSDTVTVIAGDSKPLTLRATQGSPMFGGLATFQFQGFTPLPPGSSFSALIDWGDGTPLDSGAVTGGPTIFGAGMPFPGEPVGVGGGHIYVTPGTYVVGIELIAPDGEIAKTTAEVVVAPDPAGPTELGALPRSGLQGVPLDATLAGFRFAGSPAADGYVAAVNWGDGSPLDFVQFLPLPIPLGVGYTGPNWGIQGTHTYAAPGTYPIEVYLVRPGFDHDQVATSATIAADPDAVTAARAVPVAGTQGVALTDAALALFDVADPADYRAAIDWGDGSAPTVGAVAAYPLSGGPDAQADGSHAYAAPGTYKVTINLLGPNGESRSLATSATIAPAPVPTVTATNIWFAEMAWARQVADRSRFW